MNKFNYEELLEYLIDISKNTTLIKGFADLHRVDAHLAEREYQFKNIKVDSYYKIIGNCDNDEMIIESLSCEVINADREGEYEFTVFLKYIQGEYDEYGRCTSRDYLDIDYIKIEFIQSFEERNRERVLNSLLESEFEKMFTI